MSKTFEDWVKEYENKTGEKYEVDERFRTFFEPEKGFAQMTETASMIVVNQCCGDAQYWKGKAEELAKEKGKSHLGTWCIREILPYIKLFGYEIEKIEELPEGMKRYHCRNKKTGKVGLASPSFRSKNGNIGYMITCEV